MDQYADDLAGLDRASRPPGAQSRSFTPPAAAKSPIISAATAPSASPRWCWSAPFAADAEDIGPSRPAPRRLRRHPQGHGIDRSQFFRDLSMPFYGFNRDGAKLSEGLRETFWLMGMAGGIKGRYDTSMNSPRSTSPTTCARSTSRHCSSTATTTRSSTSPPPRSGAAKIVRAQCSRSTKAAPTRPRPAQTGTLQRRCVAFIRGDGRAARSAVGPWGSSAPLNSRRRARDPRHRIEHL